MREQGRKLTRRDVLKLGIGAAGVLGASRFIACGGETAGKLAPTASPSSTPAPLVRVAAVRGIDLDAMTRDALNALGGAEKLINSGETVFIKANMVTLPFADAYNPFVIGECTKPEILVALADECLRAGAKQVFIGDGSHLPVLNWQLATTLDGSTNLLAEADRLNGKYEGRGSVKVVSLETDSPDWTDIPSTTYLGTIATSSLVANADKIISVPVLKTHSWAQLTLSMKNFVGTTSLSRYAHWVDSGNGKGYYDRGFTFDHSSPTSIASIYLDVVQGLQPDLAIIDASIGVEGDGPTVGDTAGRTVDMRERLGSFLLLASTDLVAADATAARVASHDVASVKQLNMAYDRGLGEIREAAIEIVGARLDELRVPWLPAVLRPTPPPAAAVATPTT